MHFYIHQFLFSISIFFGFFFSRKKESKEKENCRSANQNEDVAKIQTETQASEDQKAQFFEVAEDLKEMIDHSTFKLSQIWDNKPLNGKSDLMT